jgi:hypothetical protein
MPVHDSPVHALTRVDETHRYGCHSSRAPKTRSPGYWVKVREYQPDGTFVYTDEFVLHNMSVLCRYDMRAGDGKCEGCTNKSDTKYLVGYGLAT